ncbi:MAG TPA: response regulator transcription factor, partial [Polyangiaceae bacterium]|nr:response regulator transcription factor [Polyangiaceae bacterium]
MIRVLIADDHAVVRRGLREILTEASDIVVAGEAVNASDVTRLLAVGKFDVAVLDMNMPGASGLELLANVHATYPQLPILVLTMHPEEQFGVHVLRAGAAGFLNKESAPEKLVEAVRKVGRGGRWISTELAETLASVVAGGKDGPVHARLTGRELEVMCSLASGKTVTDVAKKLGLSV